MEQTEFKVYGYRWVVLLAFMFVVAINQLLWITFAPITGSAATYYGVSDLSIGLLSMSFMIVYIVISIPASWVIDTYGIRVAVGIGAAITGIFGLLRGILAPDYIRAYCPNWNRHRPTIHPQCCNYRSCSLVSNPGASYRCGPWITGNVPWHRCGFGADPLSYDSISDKWHASNLRDRFRVRRSCLFCFYKRTPTNASMPTRSGTAFSCF